MRGDNLFGQFREAYLDAIKDRRLVFDVQQSHMAVLDDFNKRIKVQESINSEENMA